MGLPNPLSSRRTSSNITLLGRVFNPSTFKTHLMRERAETKRQMAEDGLRLTTPSCRASLKPPVPVHRRSVVLFSSLNEGRLLQVCVTCALKTGLLSLLGCLPQTNLMASEELINSAGWV